jgi:hypothetical protein
MLACTTRVQPAGVVTTSGEVDEYVYEDPGPGYAAYPYVVYEGVPHYYVHGHWYRRTPRGWVYYRHEPTHLAEQRHEHERRERHERR